MCVLVAIVSTWCTAMHIRPATMAYAQICEYFAVGTEVRIETINHKTYRGDVVAFDHKTKTLMISILWKLQSPSNSTQRQNRNTLFVVLYFFQDSTTVKPLTVKLYYYCCLQGSLERIAYKKEPVKALISEVFRYRKRFIPDS